MHDPNLFVALFIAAGITFVVIGLPKYIKHKLSRETKRSIFK